MFMILCADSFIVTLLMQVHSYKQPMFMDYATILGKMLAQLLSEGAAQPRPPDYTNKSTIYWVTAAGGQDSPLYKSFIENMKGPVNVQHICVEGDFLSMTASPNTLVQVFCDVTSLCDEPGQPGCEELLTRSRFLETVLQLLKVSPVQLSSVVGGVVAAVCKTRKSGLMTDTVNKLKC